MASIFGGCESSTDQSRKTFRKTQLHNVECVVSDAVLQLLQSWRSAELENGNDDFLQRGGMRQECGAGTASRKEMFGCRHGNSDCVRYTIIYKHDALI